MSEEKPKYEKFKSWAKRVTALGLTVGFSLGIYAGIVDDEKVTNFRKMQGLRREPAEIVQEYMGERESPKKVLEKNESSEKTVEPVKHEKGTVYEMEGEEKIREHVYRDHMETIVPDYNEGEMEEMKEKVNKIYKDVKENGGVQNAMKNVVRDFEYIKENANSEGLLKALVGVRLTESGGGLNNVSPTGNKGIYQWGERIGREYGLEINEMTDERFDPEKATRSAAEYLKDMKERYGKWDFAILAYHQGEPRVNNLVQDYMEKHHNKEISGGEIRENLLQEYDVNLVNILEDMEVVEKTMDTEYGYSGYFYFQEFVSTLEQFDRFLEENDYVEVTDVNKHVVEQGDTLTGIKNKYDANMEELKYFNSKLGDYNTIMPGMELYVPGDTYRKNTSEIKDIF